MRPRNSEIGNVCTFYEYDAAGRTTKVIDARGRANHTFYDAAGRTYLTVQNYNGGNQTDPPLARCNWVNPHPTDNLCQLTEYDNFGRVIQTTDPLGRITRTEYDSLGRVKGTIQNSVAVTQLSQCTFPSAQTDRNLCTLYTYDPAGNLLISQDPVGRLTRTFYDELNRVVGQVENWTANGPIQTLANLQASCFGLPTNRTSNICTATTYDNVGNAIIHTDPMGRQTRTFYDEVGRVTKVLQNWVYDSTADREDCIQAANNMAIQNICTRYGYDTFGRQITNTNALNQTSLTVYDSQSRPFLSVANWDGVTLITNETHCSFGAGARSSNICTVTYYDALGRRTATKNGLGQLTSYGYDALGRQTSTTRTLAGTPLTTTTSLDVLGNRLSSTDARGNTTTYSYDTLNRLTSTTSPMGLEQTQQYNAAGWVLASLNAIELATLYEYDLFGRLTATTDPLTQTTTLAYDHLGNQTRQTDALNIVTRYQYDALNRLIGVKENDTGGTPTHQSNILTTYSYDILGNRTGITNAHGKYSAVAYDVLGRPVTVTNALEQETIYTYDALGKVRQMVDGNGAMTNYNYDGLNHLISTTYVQDNETVSHTYDALGNRLTLSDNTGVTTYTYDSLNRLTAISRGMSITSYGYDPNGNRTSLLYSDGKSVTYTYDKDNRLTQVTGWGGQQASYTYDKLGRLHTTTLPNGVVTTHSYDDANRLTQIKHQNSQLLTSYTYTLNPVGNRTQVVEAQTLNGVPSTPTTIHYTYDPLHRLTQASYGGILPEYQYTYDALGNITQSTENSVTTAKTYNDANQLVSSTSGGQTTTYTYNGAGNLTHTQIVGVSHSDTYYSYNQRHLLTSHATSTFVGMQLQAHFVYDGNGDRVQEMAYTNGQLASTTTYTNDPVGLTQVLVASKAGQTTYNLWGLDLLGQDDGQAQKLTLLTDALGSVRMQMRGTSLQASTSYGPYGSIHQQTGTSQTSYGYTGEQFHAGTGLLYLRARYYSPALHAFTARDPWAGDGMRPITLNGYNYANANPVFYVDPTGEAAGPIVWCFGIAIAIPDPGLAESACALFAVGAIGVTLVVAGPDAAQQVIDDVIDMADHIAEQCIDIVERAFNEPDPEPEQPQPRLGPNIDVLPHTGSPKTIVELGAGDYTASIRAKMLYPTARVIATNLVSDWKDGKVFYEAQQQGVALGSSELTNLYAGWLNAKGFGVEAGVNQPYENRDVIQMVGRTADIVFVNYPYPSLAYQFGRDAAQIAGYRSGTRVIITADRLDSRRDFANGFVSARGGMAGIFILTPIHEFGLSSVSWEAGIPTTWTYIVP